MHNNSGLLWQPLLWLTSALLFSTGCFTPTDLGRDASVPVDSGVRVSADAGSADANAALDASSPDGSSPLDAAAAPDSGEGPDAQLEPSDAAIAWDATTGPDARIEPFDASAARDSGFAPDAAGQQLDGAFAADAAADAGAVPDASVCLREVGGPCVDRLCDSNGWCWENPLPMGMSLRATHGTDEANVWAVGTKGMALQYDGRDFVLHHPRSQYASTGVWAGSPTDVRMVSVSEVLRWDGQAWTSQVPGAGAVLSVLWGTSATDLWAASDPGWGGQARAFRWRGSSWSEVALPTIGAVYAVDGTSSDDVWMVGGDLGPSGEMGRILHWDGTAWSESFGQAGSPFVDVAAVSSSLAGASGPDAFMRWNGTSWTALATPDDARPAVSGSSGSLVATTGDGTQYTLNGTSWSKQGSLGFTPGAFWPKVDPKIAVGEAGEFARLEGGQWNRLLPRYSATTMPLRTMWGGASDDVWAFPEYGWPVHWDGATWTEARTPQELAEDMTAGTGPNDLWVLSNSVTVAGMVLMHYDGQAWASLSVPTDANDGLIFGCWAASPGDLWLAGRDRSGAGAIWRGDGTTWVAVSVPSTGDLGHIWGTSATDVWVSGQGVMLHWNGSTWARYGLNVGSARSVLGTSGTDVIVAAGTTSYRWNGAKWTAVAALDGEFVNGLCALGDEYWAAVQSGKVFHWDGSAWTSLPVEGEAPLGCAVTPDRVVRVFGNFGMILARQY